MRRIVSQVDTGTEVYRTNREHNLGLAKRLRDALCVAREQRPQRALERLAEQGKLTVRARLRLLLDPGTPFLELSPLAASQAYEGDAPQGLVVTGIGVVNGREVMVIAGDSSLKGGSWYSSAEMGWTAALDAGDRIYERVYLSEDGQEGPRAFTEKRKPEWKGR